MSLFDARDWADFNWEEFYGRLWCSSEISYDSRGERTLEQMVDGTGDGEYIYMTRPCDEVYPFEADSVNKKMYGVEEYPQKATLDSL